MKRLVQTVLMLAALVGSGCAGDGNSSHAIATRADVRVSDGLEYVIDTYYAAADDAAVRQTRPDGEINISAIAGTSAWTSGSAEDGGDMLRASVLGHQFHALALHFDEVMRDVREGEMEFAGTTRRVREGVWPYGRGAAKLVLGEGERADALVFNFDGLPEITVTFSDWRDADGTSTPYHLSIADGSRTFEYAFTQIDRAAARPDWVQRD